MTQQNWKSLAAGKGSTLYFFRAIDPVKRNVFIFVSCKKLPCREVPVSILTSHRARFPQVDVSASVFF